MEKDTLTQGFRARAAQLLTWLTGVQQQERQQQTMQADRQVFDGMTRGMDDPDNRRQQPMPAPSLSDVAARAWAGRSYGFDGPNDVRIPREIGPASGSAEAA